MLYFWQGIKSGKKDFSSKYGVYSRPTLQFKSLLFPKYINTEYNYIYIYTHTIYMLIFTHSYNILCFVTLYPGDAIRLRSGSGSNMAVTLSYIIQWLLGNLISWVKNHYFCLYLIPSTFSSQEMIHRKKKVDGAIFRHVVHFEVLSEVKKKAKHVELYPWES